MVINNETDQSMCDGSPLVDTEEDINIDGSFRALSSMRLELERSLDDGVVYSYLCFPDNGGLAECLISDVSSFNKIEGIVVNSEADYMLIYSRETNLKNKPSEDTPTKSTEFIPINLDQFAVLSSINQSGEIDIELLRRFVPDDDPAIQIDDFDLLENARNIYIDWYRKATNEGYLQDSEYFMSIYAENGGFPESAYRGVWQSKVNVIGEFNKILEKRVGVSVDEELLSVLLEDALEIYERGFTQYQQERQIPNEMKQPFVSSINMSGVEVPHYNMRLALPLLLQRLVENKLVPPEYTLLGKEIFDFLKSHQTNDFSHPVTVSELSQLLDTQEIVESGISLRGLSRYIAPRFGVHADNVAIELGKVASEYKGQRLTFPEVLNVLGKYVQERMPKGYMNKRNLVKGYQESMGLSRAQVENIIDEFLGDIGYQGDISLGLDYGTTKLVETYLQFQSDMRKLTEIEEGEDFGELSTLRRLADVAGVHWQAADDAIKRIGFQRGYPVRIAQGEYYPRDLLERALADINQYTPLPYDRVGWGTSSQIHEILEMFLEGKEGLSFKVTRELIYQLADGDATLKESFRHPVNNAPKPYYNLKAIIDSLTIALGEKGYKFRGYNWNQIEQWLNHQNFKLEA